MASVKTRHYQFLVGLILPKLEKIDICARHITTKPKLQLIEIGKIQQPKEVRSPYPCGQLFIHNVFAYRGVVLYPWIVRVCDFDIKDKSKDRSTDDLNLQFSKKLKGKNQYYYKVLMDSRDWPYIRAKTANYTILNEENNQPLLSIEGFDYVAHEDILPYTSIEKNPIENDLVDELLTPNFKPNEKLKKLQERDEPLLQLSEVKRETTDNVRVTAIPFYIGCKYQQQKLHYWWHYTIRLENISDETVQLREREWKIIANSPTDPAGLLNMIRGRGVIGEEPILSKENPAFQYSSHVSLESPSGIMTGLFTMEKPGRKFFKCRIPPFKLESKVVERK